MSNKYMWVIVLPKEPEGETMATGQECSYNSLSPHKLLMGAPGSKNSENTLQLKWGQ